jgi:hypothetical protein
MSKAWASWRISLREASSLILVFSCALMPGISLTQPIHHAPFCWQVVVKDGFIIVKSGLQEF